jgi:hypothetical protein
LILDFGLNRRDAETQSKIRQQTDVSYSFYLLSVSVSLRFNLILGTARVSAVAGYLDSVFSILAIRAAIVAVFRSATVTGRMLALVIVIFVCHTSTLLSP